MKVSESPPGGMTGSVAPGLRGGGERGRQRARATSRRAPRTPRRRRPRRARRDPPPAALSGSRLAAARSVCILRTRRILRGTCHSYNYSRVQPSPCQAWSPCSPYARGGRGVRRGPGPRSTSVDGTNERVKEPNSAGHRRRGAVGIIRGAVRGLLPAAAVGVCQRDTNAGSPLGSDLKWGAARRGVGRSPRRLLAPSALRPKAQAGRC